MKAPAIDTHNLRIEVGKHAGELYTRLPLGYLRWMIQAKHVGAPIAQAELDRRGATVPTLEISGHAIDRASQCALEIWQATRDDNEGLHAWLVRISEQVLASDVEPKKPGCYVYPPLVLVLETDLAWPLLKTVMYSPRHSGVPRPGRAEPKDHPPTRTTTMTGTVPTIPLRPVSSSQIAEIGHDPATDTLAVRFKGHGGKPGGLYHYANFSAERFLEFSEAPSIGSHFIRTIKPAVDLYPCTRVPEEALAQEPTP